MIQFKGDKMSKMRKIRHKRIRQKVSGDINRPRLSVFKSNKHIYAQIINDKKKETLASASTLGKEFKAKGIALSNKGSALELGNLIAQRAKEKGITQVCFDRGGYKYHGKVKQVADGARKGGLQF